VTVEIRQLIRQMNGANPLWGAPRIHGELLKLGIDVGQTSVAKYGAEQVPPSQGWRTFLHNHADGIAAMDLFVVPTISFRPLYGLLIMGHGRRQLPWVGVTAHPTAEWIANQLTEACGWEQIPSLPDPGSRRCIRRDIYPPRSIDRHSRPPDLSAFTLAKRLRRTVDRLDPQGVPRSYRGVSANAICAMCCWPTWTTIMARAPTYR
jgi:hypothetical protein